MLSCKETSYLASKAMDEPLTRRERFGLWLHLAMCGLCRRYVRDIKTLHTALRRAGENGIEMLPVSLTLSERSRERIKQTVNKALQQD
ncbi:MAG: anti-sigma factor family protein [Gammaproteobacteria bacterium]